MVERISKSEELAAAKKRLEKAEKDLASSGAKNILAKINKDPAKKEAFMKMTISEQAQYISNQFTLGNASAGQAWMSYKSALNRCDRLEKEIQQEDKAKAINTLPRDSKNRCDRLEKEKIQQDKAKAKKTLPRDSKKAKSAEKNVKNTKKVPQTVVNKANNPTMPKEVEDEMKKLGQDYKLVTLEDSKGNNIYCFEKDGKHAFVMTQLKDQNPSKPMEVKSDAMNALVSEAVKQYDKKGADFTNVIGKMKDLNAVNEAERIGLSALSAQLNQMSMPDAKIKIHPTVTLVPKIKKNGKPSKKNFNIQLMDADGKVFILDKKTMEKAIKQQGNASATRGEMVDFSWNKYVEQAKEGKLPPETVASFFKEAKPNIPQTQLTAVQMAQMKDASRNG